MRRIGFIGCLLLAAPSVEAATLVIRAEGVQSAQSMVYAGICDTSFEEATCPYRGRAPAKPGVVELRVRNVKPGAYAVAVFHDTSGNGKLDRSLIGLPNEPYGFSNDVGRRGPPDFEAARIVVKRALDDDRHPGPIGFAYAVARLCPSRPRRRPHGASPLARPPQTQPLPSA